MQAFHRLFSGRPNASSLSPELNAQIITVSDCRDIQSALVIMLGLLRKFISTPHLQALYDYLPSENDLQPLLAWLTVMEKAHVHLARY